MVTAIYWQQKQKCKLEFDSVEQAVSFLAVGEAHDELAPEAIVCGDITINGDELNALTEPVLREYVEAWGK